MHRPIKAIVLTALIFAAPSVALAQAEARQAFADGKAAFAGGDFQKARDLFAKASQTDNRNPEVFLWLGKADYQLGQVHQAVAAWSKTIQLAPNEPYAKQMLQALRGQIVEVDTQIRIIEILVRKGWAYDTAARRCRELLKDKALTDAQRAKLMTLLATSLLSARKEAEVIAIVRELMLRYPDQADAAQTTLLLGRVKLLTKEYAAGLALLKKVVAEHPGTAAAAEAEYQLLRFQLAQKPDPAGAAALAKWIGANAAHPSISEARRQLVEAYLAITRQAGPASPGAALSGSDVAALAAAAEWYKHIVEASQAVRLTNTLLKHLNAHYASNEAYAAAIAGAEALLKAPLPQACRALVLRAMAGYRAEHALKLLTEQAKAGKLPAGAMPKLLADTVAVYATINKEFPAEPAWRHQAALAGRVRGLASLIPWPAKVTEPKAPHAWAVQIALPVIKADADARAVKQAVATVLAVADECARVRQRSARGMALGIVTPLLAALSPDDPAWASVKLRQIELLDADAAAGFADNLKAGKRDENARLSPPQTALLAAMAELVAREASYAATVLQRLDKHLRPWVQHGHYQVAETAYERLAPALPEARQRMARLAVARVWVAQVAAEHGRLLSAGLTVPRKLDPTLAKALLRCYSLQAGLDDADAFLAHVRSVWEGVVNHYKALEYFAVAEQAIKAKPARAVAAADDFARLKLANLREEQANRDLREFLKNYKASEKITLTPAFKSAIADYTKFITDRPDIPLASQAVQGIFRIAGLFERHRAYDVAVGVYRDFAAFAAKIKALSQSAPAAASTAERAEFAAAGALLAKARQALSKAMAEKKAEAAPPAKISAEFAAALAAYKAFIKAHPDSVLVGQAIRQIMQVALEYAKVNAWDVAEGIYADLLAGGLTIRRPERLEFARGLCHLGKVMPDHARQVLQALTLAPPVTRGGDGRFDIRSDALIVADANGRPRSAPSPTPAGAAGPGRSLRGPKVDLGTRLEGTEAYSSALKPQNGGRRARRATDELEKGDLLAMAAIRTQQQRRAAQVARMRGRVAFNQPRRGVQGKQRQPPQQGARPVLSDAEIARQQVALAAAYKIFQAIRKNYPDRPAAAQARGEILVMVGHWRSIARWQRAAALAEQFLADNPTDGELPKLRLGIARDTLAWAAQPVEKKDSTQAMLAEVADRFGKARAQLAAIVKDLPKEKAIVHQAQWDIANSFLTQARVVDAFSPTLARGQYVRAAKELQQVAETYHDHPNIASVPKMLWDIAQELAGRRYHEEAVTIWGELTIHYPTHSLAQQAAQRIAQTYQNNLRRPLLAAEAYLELNFIRGGGDLNTQNLIFQIGVSLKNEKRWVEALHVLETFVDSFPRHPSAGQALTMVGHIHQTNEAWADAIAAYRRVIDEFPRGAWVRDAKWSIAECTINLSRWREAMAAYRSYLASYAKDGKAAEAKRRVEILKDLARYQALVDEEGQRKAFDAQYQIAAILAGKLSNPVKGIIEYRKVTDRWPQSHLADDAMFRVGTTYLSMGETKKAREALLDVAAKYPTSPLADDAMYMVGKSFEDEATKLATVTRKKTVELAQRKAQQEAYQRYAGARVQLAYDIKDRITKLKAAGEDQAAELEEARGAFYQGQAGLANVELFSGQARQRVEVLTASELADRQDKINAALRKAVDAYDKASRVAAADKADESLLRMAKIYADKLKDTDLAMKTYQEIVRQFSGTAVAEDASWRIAQNEERQGKFAEAIKAYEAFLRNYRRSPRAGAAQFAVAENYEQLGQWVKAMDAYTNYITNYPSGPLVQKAKEQINWIKTYRL